MAYELAETASLTLGLTVTVLAGIYLKHPSKQDIEGVVVEVRSKMDETLGKMIDRF